MFLLVVFFSRREFENKSKEVEEVEEVEEVMDVDECKVMDADECSSDNGADDFYDDELEIIPHNAPVVDLTEAQPGALIGTII